MKYDSASVCLFDSSAAAKCQTSKLLERPSQPKWDKSKLQPLWPNTSFFQSSFSCKNSWFFRRNSSYYIGKLNKYIYIYDKIANVLKTIVTRVVWQFGSTLWQYGLWSFQMGDTKLERFLPKNQPTQRKLLNFEFWIIGELSKSTKI